MLCVCTGGCGSGSQLVCRCTCGVLGRCMYLYVWCSAEPYSQYILKCVPTLALHIVWHSVCTVFQHYIIPIPPGCRP